MKARKFFIPLIFLISCIFVFSACNNDPYKDYVASGIEAKSIPFNYEDDYLVPYDEFGYGRAEIFTDYESYATYNFNLNYTNSYFALNDLLIFVVSCCSSDEMQFSEILENDGKLYPLFLRKKIGNNQPVTADFIVISCYAEISKESKYNAGEIIYRYK